MTNAIERYAKILIERVRYINDLTNKLCDTSDQGRNKKERMQTRYFNEYYEKRIYNHERRIKDILSGLPTTQLLEIVKIIENKATMLEFEYALGVEEYSKSFVISSRMAFDRILRLIAEELVNRLYVDIMILKNNERNDKARKCHIRINRLLKNSTPKMLELMRKNLSIEMEECGDNMGLLFNIIRHEEILRNQLTGKSLN